MILSVLCSMWIIPFSMIIYNVFGTALTYVVNFFGAIVGVAMASKSFWWICPFSWYSRVQVPLLKLFPNGLMVNEGNVILNWKAIPTGILLSLVNFVVLTICLVRLIKWRRENG